MTAIDDELQELASAEHRLRLRVESVLSSVVPVPEGGDGPDCFDGLGNRLSGGNCSERRLLALLAFRDVEGGGRADRAAGLAERALAGGRLLADGIGSPALLAAGIALGAAGRTESAESLFASVAERAERSNSRAVLAAARGLRGVERYRRGAVAGALSDLEAALAVACGQPWETMVDDGRAYLLRVRIERGELMLAERDLHVWCATGALPETPFGNRLLIERGRLRLVQGRLADAIADLQTAARRLEDESKSMLFEWRGVAAQIYHRLGEQQTALTLAHQDLERATTWGAARQLGSAMTTLGMIEGGPDGIGHVREACGLLARSPALLDRARALVSLGLLLAQEREPGRAHSPLLAARQLARRCGARAVVALAEQALATGGNVRRRPAMVSGRVALTPTERRIARLAARGLSNPDIARALYITRKTVEMHLGNAYRKLQINSRQQLQRALPLEDEAAAPAPGDEAARVPAQPVTRASTSLGVPGSRPAAASLAI